MAKADPADGGSRGAYMDYGQIYFSSPEPRLLETPS
jgi:hypothetical protein